MEEKRKKTEARIVFATNHNLEDLISCQKLRQDLFFRINRIKLEILPLRERSEDIPLLAEYFLKKFEQKTGKKILKIESDALDLLKKYNWPGNIRELKNEIERAYIYTCGNSITKLDISPEIMSHYISGNPDSINVNDNAI